MARPATPGAAVEVLRLLKARHNVLVGGPPATGKTLLLGEVAVAFESFGPPPHVPGARVPIPPGAAGPMPDWMPSPTRSNRRVFRTAFHQGSKFRDWLRGLVPIPGGAGVSFQVSKGIFYQAMEHARLADSAALVVVDEINRGPAVQVFGDSLVAMEGDKRLAPDGTRTSTTTPIQILSDAGLLEAVDVPYDLYIVAAMNRADTSVEPLDVAFLRRWQPYTLAPDEQIAATWLGLPNPAADPPAAPATPQDVYLALHRAWRKVNHRISLLRGAEYQLGHGALMSVAGGPPTSLDEALLFAAGVWGRLREHVDELFFGDVRAIAAIVSADQGESPFKLQTGFFAEAPTHELLGPSAPDAGQLYKILRAIALDT